MVLLKYDGFMLLYVSKRGEFTEHEFVHYVTLSHTTIASCKTAPKKAPRSKPAEHALKQRKGHNRRDRDGDPTPFEWEDKEDYFCQKGMMVQKVPGDGFCFLHALQASLNSRGKETYKLDELCHFLMSYILDNAETLSHFHSSKPDLIKDAIEFFMHRNYNQRVVDLIINAVGDALGVSVYLYFNDLGVLSCHEWIIPEADVSVHLLFNESLASEKYNHYDAVVPMGRPSTSLPGKFNFLDMQHMFKVWCQKNSLNTDQLEEYMQEEVMLLDLAQNLKQCKLQADDAAPLPDVSLLPFKDLDLSDNCEIEDVPVPQWMDDDQDDDDEAEVTFLGESQSATIVIDPPDETATRRKQRRETASLEVCRDSSASGQDDRCVETSSRHETAPSTSSEGDTAPSSLVAKTALVTAQNLWMGPGQVPLKTVERIPGDIDGDCAYLIPNCEDSWMDDVADQRHFDMHTSRRSGLVGKRRTGPCKGSHICQNDCCPYLKSSGGIRNHTFWKYVRGEKACKSCEMIMIQEACGEGGGGGVRKIVEFHEAGKFALVFHYGKHTCHLRHNQRLQRIELKKRLDKVKKMPGQSVKEYAIQQVLEKFQNGDMEGAVREADLFADPTVAKRLVLDMQAVVSPSLHSFDAVAIVKRNAGMKRRRAV